MSVKVLLVAAEALSLIVPAPTAAPVGLQPAVTTVASEPQEVETTRVTLPLVASQSLTDVLLLTEAWGYPIQAYRFENAEIVGEYSPQTGLRPDEYLADFQELYGTQPEFVAVMIDVPVSAAESWYREDQAKQVEVRGPKFEAAPVSIKHIDKLLQPYRERNVRQTADIGLEGAAAAAASATTWKPTNAGDEIFRVGSGTVYLSQFYSWDGVTASTDVIDPSYGFEMEINIRADSATYQGGSRPFCAGGYKDQPFAKNYGWTWAALVNTGTGLTTLSSAVGAYADYNDLSDPCEKNSMAIGFQSPWQVPDYPDNSQEVLVTIQAPRGVENTGYIGAVVQSVNASQCLVSPWMARTDCMGVVSGTVGDRAVLGEWRNWRAPTKCWKSYDYGATAPVTYIC